MYEYDDDFSLYEEYEIYSDTLEVFSEGVVDDIKGWYRRRLTSEELDEAKEELKRIMSTIKIPNVRPTVKIFSSTVGSQRASVMVSPNFVHIIDRNGIATINIVDSFSHQDKGKYSIAGVKKAQEIIDKLNAKSKHFKYFVTRELLSTNGSGYVGVIYAYRKKDDMEEDSYKGRSIDTLSNQTIIVF